MISCTVQAGSSHLVDAKKTAFFGLAFALLLIILSSCVVVASHCWEMVLEVILNQRNMKRARDEIVLEEGFQNEDGESRRSNSTQCEGG